MSEYALITLNMTEYVDIYLKKQSVEYARIVLKVSDAGHFTIYGAVTEAETYSEHCQTFKMEHFAKRMFECRCAIINFSGHREGVMELGTSIDASSKTQEKEALQAPRYS